VHNDFEECLGWVRYGMVWYGMDGLENAHGPNSLRYSCLALRICLCVSRQLVVLPPKELGLSFHNLFGFTKKSQKGNSDVTVDLSGSSL